VLANIALINESSVVPDADFRAAVAALQKQVSNDFTPAWGTGATLYGFAKGSTIPAGYWGLAVLDDSDQAGALGYHDLTKDGLPLGKVFAKTDQQYGASWTVTASHELLEMLADPFINLTAQNGSRLWAVEVGDPVEADALGYQIDGVLVSDFVYPSWFDPNVAADIVLDHGGTTKAPFTLAKGGYASVLDLSGADGWKQVYGEGTDPTVASRPNVGSRRERRRTPREQWQRSTQ